MDRNAFLPFVVVDEEEGVPFARLCNILRARQELDAFLSPREVPPFSIPSNYNEEERETELLLSLVLAMDFDSLVYQREELDLRGFPFFVDESSPNRS